MIIVQTSGGSVVADHRFIWVGLERCEERDASGNVVKRFYPQGEVVGGTPRYFLKDHLGSIRAVAESDASISMQYDYSPWGEQSVISGNNPADFGFTGHYTGVGPTLAPYRLYNAQLGRFISRDPIGEKGGINLYAYVGNDPVNGVDPLGLAADIWVYRTSKLSPASVFVFDGHNFVGAFYANTSRWLPDPEPPSDRTYTLTPKTAYDPGDSFVAGTPTVTGLVRVHPNGPSKGCLTTPLDWADRIWDIMNENLGNGGTRITYKTVAILPTIRAGQEGQHLPAPTRHSWLVFNIQGAEPVPQWPTGKGPGTQGYIHY